MKLKQKWHWFILGLLGLVLTGIWFKEWIKDFDPGKLRPKDRFIVSLAKITDVAYFPWIFKPANLPIYEVLVTEGELQSVINSLPKPFSNAILESGQSKKGDGKLKIKDQEYDIKLSIRGDLPNHWSLAKKSWKITLEKNQTLDGMTELNFILPSDRGLLFESFSMNLAKKFNLITPKNWLGILKINHQTQGIYYIRESYDAAMLARNQRPEGDIYKERDDPNRYDYKGQKMPGSKHLWDDQSFWKKASDGKIYSSGDQSLLQALLQLLNNADDKTFKANIGNLVDLDYFYHWQALSLLLGSYHQDDFHNQNWYLNPNSGRFEILPGEFVLNISMPFDSKHNRLVDRILSFPEFKQQRNEVLKTYLTEENLQQDLAYFKNLYQTNRTAFYQDQLKFLSNYGFDITTEKQLEGYQARFRAIQRELNEADFNLRN